jgi:hypothetical protein
VEAFHESKSIFKENITLNDAKNIKIPVANINKGDVLIELDYIKFDSKQSLFEKLDKFKEKIKHLLKFEITTIAIEEPLQKFQGKFSSAHTISILNFFNGL